MERKTKFIVGGAAVAAALAAGTGIAVAGGEDENEGPDVPITGDALDQASRAALEHTGEGTVTDTEVGDEESMLRGRGHPRRRQPGRRAARRALQRRRQRVRRRRRRRRPRRRLNWV